MRHLGQTLKNHIETNQLKKRPIAEKVGISTNYLSTLFNKASFDCSLWEKLCEATGLMPSIAFDNQSVTNKNYSDIRAQTIVGPATVTITTEKQALLDLLEEKERLIQVLLATSGLKIGTGLEQADPKRNV